MKGPCMKNMLQFLNPSSNFDVNTLKLKLKVCTSIASRLFHFKSIVVAYRAKIMKMVTVQIFLNLTVSPQSTSWEAAQQFTAFHRLLKKPLMPFLEVLIFSGEWRNHRDGWISFISTDVKYLRDTYENEKCFVMS